MSTTYTVQLSLSDVDDTVLVNNIQVGNETVRFQFQWAVASEEQYNLIMKYIDTKTKSDPLNDDGTYTYNYDYMDYYLKLANKTDEELDAWLDTNPVLPNSILNSVRASQILMLHKRISEVVSLKPVIDQYKEVLRWQFKATYRDQVTVGFIEPGGWYRNQDANLCFRFVSELPYIGRRDFNNVSIEFEVGNE